MFVEKQMNLFHNRAMNRQYRGFSLAELTIVVAIISILVAGAVAHYMDRIEVSRKVRMKQEMEIFHQAALRYYTKFSHWPEKIKDLIGYGIIKLPPDPWGGEYRIENRYYLICRPPDEEPYRIPMCPRIKYNMFASAWARVLPVDPEEFSEQKKAKKPFEAAVYTEIAPSEKVIEYVSTLASYSSKGDYEVSEAVGKGLIYAVYHAIPKMVFYSLPVRLEFEEKGKLSDEQHQILMEKVVRTIYKYLMSQGPILRTYYHGFGGTDGDVDMDGKYEVRIEYDGDTMLVHDLKEAVGGLNMNYIEEKIQRDIDRGVIYYDMNNIMLYWDRSYFAHWSVW